jgi:rSAM/selenodomain-associated transferase 1
VKTRLLPLLGAELAARLYRALAEETLQLTAPSGGAYQRWLAFSPREARDEIAAWFPGETLLPQVGEDLGARMAAAFDEAFRRGATRVVVIGTDVLGLSREIVLEALAALEGRPLVLAPAQDGGYCLLGLTRPCPELFEGIAWSTPTVLATTLAHARERGLNTRLLAPLMDIDTPDDLRLGWNLLADLLSRYGLLEAVRQLALTGPQRTSSHG